MINKLYISMTMDGYIATKEHSLNYLNKYMDNQELSNSYTKMISKVDCIVIGRNSYDYIMNETNGHWPYELETYVLTTRKISTSLSTLHSFNGTIEDLNIHLKNKNFTYIWIVGGSNIVKEYINNDLLDEIELSILPETLNDGVKLFNHVNEKNWQVKLVEQFDSIVNITYTKK